MAATSSGPLLVRQRQQPEFTDKCESISTCLSIERIVSALQEYQARDLDEIIASFDKNSHPYLSDDFNHVLLRHLGDDKQVAESQREFFAIHQHIASKLKPCALEKCGKFSRNNRDREKQDGQGKKLDKEVEYFVDVMDTIHCFFLHSFDIGYRIAVDGNADETELKVADGDDSDDEDDDDSEMQRIRRVLQSKRKRLQGIRGADRCANTIQSCSFVS